MLSAGAQCHGTGGRYNASRSDEGATKAPIRSYEEACDPGGTVGSTHAGTRSRPFGDWALEVGLDTATKEYFQRNFGFHL